MKMLLANKDAVIYGGSGAIGSAVARAFARGGTKVFLAGRTLAKLNTVAREISSARGAAETAQVDALDEHSVEQHIAEVVKKGGGVDISFNVMGSKTFRELRKVGKSLQARGRREGNGSRLGFMAVFPFCHK
jgi:3-oxoacyl-[acyl-carrier protein] reductase